jgi:hypothetical protein
MSNWNIGLLFYIINCFVGSFFVSFQFTNEINRNPSFHFSNSETIGIAIFVRRSFSSYLLAAFTFYQLRYKSNE